MDKRTNQSCQNLNEMIRREPVKSVLLAVAAGFLLCLLPVNRLIGVLVKILFQLIKPALFILGVVKLLEITGVDPNPSQKS
jgi:hypothetical protein